MVTLLVNLPFAVLHNCKLRMLLPQWFKFPAVKVQLPPGVKGESLARHTVDHVIQAKAGRVSSKAPSLKLSRMNWSSLTSMELDRGLNIFHFFPPLASSASNQLTVSVGSESLTSQHRLFLCVCRFSGPQIYYKTLQLSYLCNGYQFYDIKKTFNLTQP